jgi:hypothetical protein
VTEPIEQLLERKIRQLLADAAEHERIQPDALEAVQRLAALADLAAATRARQRRRWPLFAAAVLTLLVVSVLLFSRVRDTDIELDVRTSSLSFLTPARQGILGTQTLRFVGATGVGQVRLPDSHTGASDVLAAAEGELCEASFETVADARTGSSLSIPLLTVPPGTRVSVVRTAPHAVELTLTVPSGVELPTEISVKGTIRIAAHGPAHHINRIDAFAYPEVIRLNAASATPITLQLTSAVDVPFAFSPELAATDISFFEIQQDIDMTRAVPRQVSSLLAGTLYLEALNDKAITVRPYEELRFGRSNGMIRKLQLVPADANTSAGESFALQAHADVSAMTIGAGKNVRSLMPTYLESLAARQGLALFWGSTLYLIGVVASILRWLRVSQ